MNIYKKRLMMIVMIVLSSPLLATGAEDDFTMSQKRKGVIHGTLMLQSGSGSGCGYCHSISAGYGGLADKEEWTCLVCHSPAKAGMVEDRLSVKKRPDIRKKLAKTDILSEFEKPFSHPTLRVTGMHSRRETFPENAPGTPRHAECIDCHDNHEVTQWNKLGPVKVTGAQGEKKNLKKIKDMIRDEAVPDYELCFNCHGDSANLPLNQTNKRIEFSPNNPSYHPVVAEGKNTVVPSLKPPYAAQKRRSSDISILRCGDCHGNNDEKGPTGPHGSIYPAILVRNYNINDGQPESSFQYSLCYMCHERDSILRNDSFRYHAIHIQGNPAKGTLGTSCYTCHNSHGSTDNKFLIKFNRDVVFPNLSSGQLRFVSTGTFSGECYLSCHNVSHNPKRY